MPDRLQEELLQVSVPRLVVRGAYHHHDVAPLRKSFLILPENLSEDPPGSVPLYRHAHPAGSDDTDAPQALLLRRLFQKL